MQKLAVTTIVRYKCSSGVIIRHQTKQCTIRMGSPSKLPTYVHQFWSTPKRSKMGLLTHDPCSLQWLHFWFHVFLLLVGWSKQPHLRQRLQASFQHPRTLRNTSSSRDYISNSQGWVVWKAWEKKTTDFVWLLGLSALESIKTSPWVLGVFFCLAVVYHRKNTGWNSERRPTTLSSRNQTKVKNQLNNQWLEVGEPFPLCSLGMHA